MDIFKRSCGIAHVMTTFVVVRHGETTWNHAKRLQGWAPAQLNDNGRAQAVRLGATLTDGYDVDRVLSSDLTRTRETVEILLDDLDAPVTFDSAWRERDLGVHQGLLQHQLADRFPTYDLEQSGMDAAHRRPESGESLVDLQHRVLDQLRTTLAKCEPGETILIVTHGGPIRVLLGDIKDQNLETAITAHAQDNCAINEFAIDEMTEAVAIIRENESIQS